MDFAESQRRPGKHPVGLIIVIVLHLLLGWALLSGLARKVVEVVKAPIETKIIEEVKPPPPPPPENLPPPPKNLPPPPAFVPPPEVQVAQPQAPTITTTNVQPPPQEVKISPAAPAVQAPPAPPARAARPAIADINACAPKGSDYPLAAARANATGTTRVRFTVDANGKLAGRPEVVKSAGPSREHRLLDRVAVDKLSECSFKPGIDENGHPAGGTFEFEYVWTLQ